MTTSAGAVQLDITGNTKSIEQSFASLEAMGKSVGRKIAKVFSAAALTGFAKSCVEAASAAQQTANRVATVFPTMTKQVEAFASSATKNMGMGAGAAKGLMSQFGMMAQGMGIGEQASAGMSAAMTQLTGDIAAFYGISQDEAAGKLQGVFTGMTRGLKTLGVNMSEANLQQHALSLGINQSVSEMSQADLAALRLSYAQATLGKISGYAARNVGTWAGQSALLSQNMARLKAALGKALIAALLPALKVINLVISALADMVNAVIAAIEKLTGKKLADFMGAAAGGAVDMGEAADGAATSLDDLGGAQQKATKSTKAQTKAQKDLNRALAGFDKINKLTSRQQLEVTTPTDTGEDAAAALAVPVGLSDAMMNATGFGDALENVNNQAGKLKDITIPPALVAAFEKLGKAVDRFFGILKDAGKWVYDNVLKPLGEWTINRLAPVLVEILSNAFDVLCDVLEAIKPAWQWVWDHFFKPLAQFAGDAVIAMLEGIAGALQGIHDFSQKHPKAFETLVIGLGGLFALTTLGGGFGKMLGAVVGGKGLGGLKKVFAGSWLGKAGKGIGGVFRALFKHPVALILLAVATAVGLIYKNWDKIRKTKVGKALERAGKKLEKLGEKLQPLMKKLKELHEKVAKRLFEKLKEAWPKIEPVLEKLIDFLIDDLCNKLSFLIDAFSALVDWISAVVDAWSEDGPFGKALKTAQELLQPVIDLIANAPSKTIELTAVARDKLGAAWEHIKGAWDFLKDKTAHLVGAAVDALGRTWEGIKDTWAGFKDKGAALIATAKNSLGQTWEGIKATWRNAKSKVIQIIAKASRQLGQTWEGIKKTWANAKSKTISLIAQCKNQLGRAWETVKNAWKWLTNKKATLTATFNDLFSGALRRVWNTLANGLNDAIDIINTIPGVWIRHYVPYLAKGGYVARNTPQLAVIGDNRREGEIVAPESKLQSMADKAAQGGDSSRVEALLVELIQAVRDSSVDVTLDGQSITRTVVRGINAQTKATGAIPLLI